MAKLLVIWIYVETLGNCVVEQLSLKGIKENGMD